MARTAGCIVGYSAAPTLIASALIWFLNDLSLLDAVVITLWLWPLFTCLLAGPLVLTVLLLRLARQRTTWDHLAGVTLAALFGGLWVSRLEPAHQLLSIRPHVSSAGVIETFVIAAASAAILAAVWRLRGGIRLPTVSLLLVVGIVVLSATARGLEPTRDRSRFVTRLTAAHANQARVQDPPARVLVIGIDGMEWRAIASSSGRRVVVLDPVPFWVIGERVNGLFAWPSRDWFRVSRRASIDGPTTFADEPLAIEPSLSSPAIDLEERARVDLTIRAFADIRPDLGVYYTHFVDRSAHDNWDFRFPDEWFGGDPHAELASNFNATTIANAYAQVDAHIRDLTAAFGAGTVILVSDHGWEFNEYKHFLSPYGVLIVAHTGATGYGGVVDVLSVAPTILSLLRLPIATDMQPPIADVTATWGTTTAYDGLQQDFVIEDPLVVDPDRRRLLKSLGYLSGQ